jgi:hypothetical protein
VPAQIRKNQPQRRPTSEVAESVWTRLARSTGAWLMRSAASACPRSGSPRRGVPVVRRALKLAGVSPVADLVAAVVDVDWADPSWAVPCSASWRPSSGWACWRVAGCGWCWRCWPRRGSALPGAALRGLAVGARLRAPRPWSAPPQPGRDRLASRDVHTAPRPPGVDARQRRSTARWPGAPPRRVRPEQEGSTDEPLATVDRGGPVPGVAGWSSWCGPCCSCLAACSPPGR